MAENSNSPNGTPLAQAPIFKQYIPTIQASMFRKSQIKNNTNILKFGICDFISTFKK